jgi:hypothetical protein
LEIIVFAPTVDKPWRGNFHVVLGLVKHRGEAKTLPVLELAPIACLRTQEATLLRFRLRDLRIQPCEPVLY